ncbi:hypothetical protein BVRB_042670, partial [Beta vulgaris subsp. vulgaris]
DRDIEMDVEADMAVEPEAQLEIVPEAQVKDIAQAERNRAQQNAIQFQKCPSCGELVKQNELSEHVRICLLDPRWKVQKQASLQKQRESNLISGSDISRHLSELARKRQDIFTTPSGSAAPPAPTETTQSTPVEEYTYPPQEPPNMPAYQAPYIPVQPMQGFPQPVQYPYG